MPMVPLLCTESDPDDTGNPLVEGPAYRVQLGMGAQHTCGFAPAASAPRNSVAIELLCFVPELQGHMMETQHVIAAPR